MEFKRCSGILMPISSLPGGYGIGRREIGIRIPQQRLNSIVFFLFSV